MSLKGRHICLVSSGQPASNPRLVKEADALSAVGARVTVVGVRFSELLTSLEGNLLHGRAWRYLPVDVVKAAQPVRYRLRALRQKLASTLPRQAWGCDAIAEAAFSRITGALKQTLLRQVPDADLYHAHNLAALPAAAAAAERSGARLGFDAEDDHVGEFPMGSGHDRKRGLVHAIERRYLPRCHLRTASSPLIARAYEERYGRPVTSLLNVFPLSERPAELREGPVPASNPFSFYWFSQTLGPGRGLENFIRAVSRSGRPCELHLRGNPVAGYAEALRELAGNCDWDPARLHFHPLAPARDLTALAMRHGAGLSLEIGDTPNRSICLTNKIFHYLLAGIPVVLSDTPAQRALAAELGEAALLAPNDPAALGAALTDWIAAPDRLARARRAAWTQATQRYHWEHEQHLFLSAVADAMT